MIDYSKIYKKRASETEVAIGQLIQDAIEYRECTEKQNRAIDTALFFLGNFKDEIERQNIKFNDQTQAFLDHAFKKLKEVE